MLDGASVGSGVGSKVGTKEGSTEGPRDGAGVGSSVGASVGIPVGCKVGAFYWYVWPATHGTKAPGDSQQLTEKAMAAAELLFLSQMG